MKYSCELSKDGEPVALGSATIVCVARQPDHSMKAVPIPPDIASRFTVSDGAAS